MGKESCHETSVKCFTLDLGLKNFTLGRLNFTV